MNTPLRIVPAIACIMTALLPCTAVRAQDAIPLDSRLEMFIDHFLIEHMDEVSLRLHEPLPQESVLSFDRPWEGRYCGYVTILKDGGLFRMYYRGLPEAGADGSDLEVTCYAESPDGIHFTKPNLGLFEVMGTRDNNVILAKNAPFSHNFAPFLDTRPDVPDEERFKALAGTEKSGLVAFVSADGKSWRKLQEEPVIRDGKFDSQNVAFWSEPEGCYVSYFRIWSQGGWKGYRWVGRATSPDFVTWSDTVPMDKGEAPWEHIYTNQTIAYPRAPHIYLSLAARFMPGRRAITKEEAKQIGVEEKYDGDCSDNVLMTSRGGNIYDRTFLEAFIKPGIGPENWTSRTNYPVRGILQTGENELSLYIQQNYGQPTGYVRRYTLRLDGFASIHAPYKGGEWISKPIVFKGAGLHLNFATSAAGDIRVELQTPDGHPIPGYALEEAEELIGNTTDRTACWKGGSDLSGLAGNPVRLRMVMKDADLYSVQFR